MLSWDDFRYVKAIADTRSLGGAAQTLGVNHSTVFRRLGQIEHQLGSRLFDRGRGGYTLTTCGEDMVRLAERVSEDITAFERRVTGQDLRPSGELRITTNDMVLLHLLTDVLVKFRRAYPEIVLDIVVSNALLNLSKRDADVAVRATYQAPDSLTGLRVGRIGWSIFGHHTLAGKPFDVVADPARHNWVGFADNVAIVRTSKWLRDHAVTDKHCVYKVNTLLGIAEAAAGGAGLALLPCFIGLMVPGLARLCPPLPELEGELWLLTHPDLSNTARVRAFLDFCAAEMATRHKLLDGSN
jgi:DNA-binding transcriptional LysR family regulator